MQHPPEHQTPLPHRTASDPTPHDAGNGAAGAGPAYDENQPVQYSRPFVLGVIMMTVAVTLIAISLIYYRWLNVSEPVSAIVIEGNESLAPTKLRLTSTDHPAIDPPDLTAENKFVTPVLLHPGSYILTAKQNEKTLMQFSFKIEPHRGIFLSIPKFLDASKQHLEAAR